jgi:hypothetical protein
MDEILEQGRQDDVKNLLKWRSNWRTIGNICEASSKVLFGAGIILQFSSAYYEPTELAFAAGCTNTVALSSMLFAKYAMGESKQRTMSLNLLLRSLGKDTVVDLNVEEVEKTESKTM